MAMGERELKVVKGVQDLIEDQGRNGPITPEVIDEKIDDVITFRPTLAVDLDRGAVTDELIRRYSVWIGADRSLWSSVGHVDWLNSDRKSGWRYWQRYAEFLEQKLSIPAIGGLDKATDNVLRYLEDPQRAGPWDRRGLVVGHVQSGKTGNYTGLICKAADAGYKIIIVLAGLHNSLRSQTQMRLDEGFLGFETSPDRDPAAHPAIGVGIIDSGIRPNYATNRAERGDFNAHVVRNLGISPEEKPWLFVVKKNKSVLDHLYRWIRDHVADRQEAGRHLVTHLPLLMIDDEADNGSVDTGEQVVGEDGMLDREHQPTAINRLIRKLMHSFHRAAYVGYTATPFANIFIHDKGRTEAEGPDLFPSAFIVNLAAPSDYIGPSKVFGVREAGGRTGGLPVVNKLEGDHEAWMPTRHKRDHVPLYDERPQLPPSLAEAVDVFLLACAARRLRGQQDQHCSMLVHVTRFSGAGGAKGTPSVQQLVYDQIDEHVLTMRQRIERSIDHEAVIAGLEELWDREFVKKAPAIRNAHPELCGPIHSWTDIRDELLPAIKDVTIRRINGTAKDALDYVEHQTTGLKVIAIGGDKLSRGLTLEGLTVSYFLRASRMYDTLMQMGRWFGYRPGYLDLCRLYTTSELVLWFGHITDAAEELREEFDLMAASGGTPRDYGLKVQSHPTLMVTSRMKMRTARDQLLSFSGSVLETVALRRDRDSVEQNLETTRRLIGRLGAGEEPRQERPNGPQTWEKGRIWHGVPGADVADLFATWRTHPDAWKVNGPMISKFIRGMNQGGELTSWTVAVIGAGDKAKRDLANVGVEVPMLERGGEESSTEAKYSIGRLLSPRDEAIDLDLPAWAAALALTREIWRQKDPDRRAFEEPDAPSGPAIRKIRGFGAEGVPAHPERGLLLLYALDPSKAYGDTDALRITHGVPIVAFGVSFPGSNHGTKVSYKVNNIGWEQEYGASE